MSNHQNPNPNAPDPALPLRPHEYDGIQEYDQRLPNWWLWTFYLAMAASVVYWFLLHQPGGAPLDDERIAAAMQRIETARLAGAMTNLDDNRLWEMSVNADFTGSGRQTYQSLCAACHGQNLEGGIGLNLVDSTWKFGNTPSTIHRIIAQGSPDPASGMQAWEPALGSRRVAEVAAYILSNHTADAMANHSVTNPLQK